ncbi:S-adenosyl-L-methionine-dependent methyltransferase [Mycena amicta]|nr:S-adenosyl-L-methionine-dependent methyltransferase [Mycena amicta]
MSETLYYAHPLSLVEKMGNSIAGHNETAFLECLGEMNGLLRRFKGNDGGLMPKSEHPPQQVATRILEETHNRCVSIHSHQVKQHDKKADKAADRTYGELLPPMLYEIFDRTGLHDGSTFVDLGSGTGNVVRLASLRFGCFSYGVELEQTRWEVGEVCLADLRVRSHLWGYRCGRMELEHGDMMTSPRALELVGIADVVLMANTCFSDLSNLVTIGREMKPGAYLVCMRTASGPTRQSTVTKRPREAQDAAAHDPLMQFAERQDLETPEKGLSWTAATVPFYIYRIKTKKWEDVLDLLEEKHVCEALFTADSAQL